jgi:Cu-Zn family superoxide dismutase
MTHLTRNVWWSSLFLLVVVETAAGAASEKAAKVAPVKVTMNQITVDGVGDAVGTVTLHQTKAGVELAVDLSKLSPGEHGFHMHE